MGNEITKEYYKPTELAIMFECSPTMMYRWIRESSLPNGTNNFNFKVHRNDLYMLEHLVKMKRSTPTKLIATIIELENDVDRLERRCKRLENGEKL